MLMVIGTMVAVSIVAFATLDFAVNAMPGSRHNEDYQIAGAAAQAGVNDFLGRLAVCATYYEKPCTNSSTDNTSDAYSAANPAKWLDGAHWVSVPGTSSGTPSTAEYTYKLLAANASTGILRVEVKGQSNGVTRVFTDDLSKKSLLDYIYYTNLEDLDPELNYITDRIPARTTSGPTCTTKNGTKTCITTTTVWDNPSTTGRDLSSLRATCGAQTDGSNAQYYYGTPSQPTGRSGATWNWYSTITTTTAVTNREGKTTTTTATTNPAQPENCTEITFAAGDTISGPMHTNDAMQINGATFTSTDTETGWSISAPVQPPTKNKWYWGSGPSSSSKQPVSSQLIDLPPNNTAIEQQADPAFGGQGCLYTGPTKITLLSNNQMRVVSPYTTAANTPNTGCYTSLPMTSAQTVSAPANGVVYVQGIPAWTGISCNMQSVIDDTGYPDPKDIQAQDPTNLGTTISTAGTTMGQFGCADGTAYISGSKFNGQYTIATAKDVYVTGTTTYGNSSAGGDVLGLVANGFVYVYHPIACTSGCTGSTPSYSDITSSTTFSSGDRTLTDSGDVSNIEIDAAILSVTDSFVVETWNEGSQRGSLTVKGGIYQQYRGPVGTSSNNNCSNGTGYCKSYSYDTRLPFQDPPPDFLDPVSAAWRIANQAEQNASNN
jgi:hypothetical protein